MSAASALARHGSLSLPEVSSPLSTDRRGAAVALRALEKTYDGRGAVRGISLDVRSGEFLTLLGPSGSGKTTTLMMIAGFEAPSTGDIAVDGRSMLGIPPHRRNLGMVFQSYALFPHMTVGENIAFPLRQRRVARVERDRRVEESLELMRLQGYGKRYPRQLSGGQQQRVALARAIVFRPHLLLLDEPLSALDKQLRQSLQLELRRLHAELGITFIFVTHDQEEALTMSDRIAVMKDGLIAQVGPPEELYNRPRDKFVASFLGESNFLPATVCGFEDDVVVASCLGVTVRAMAATRPSLGDQVTLTTRPERMHFVDPHTAAIRSGGTSLNRMRTTVSDTVFAGERSRFHCQVPGGVMLVVKQPSGATMSRPTVGEEIDVAWPVSDTVIV